MIFTMSGGLHRQQQRSCKWPVAMVRVKRLKFSLHIQIVGKYPETTIKESCFGKGSTENCGLE